MDGRGGSVLLPFPGERYGRKKSPTPVTEAGPCTLAIALPQSWDRSNSDPPRRGVPLSRRHPAPLRQRQSDPSLSDFRSRQQQEGVRRHDDLGSRIPPRRSTPASGPAATSAPGQKPAAHLPTRRLELHGGRPHGGEVDVPLLALLALDQLDLGGVAQEKGPRRALFPWFLFFRYG